MSKGGLHTWCLSKTWKSRSSPGREKIYNYIIQNENWKFLSDKLRQTHFKANRLPQTDFPLHTACWVIFRSWRNIFVWLSAPARSKAFIVIYLDDVRSSHPPRTQRDLLKTTFIALLPNQKPAMVSSSSPDISPLLLDDFSPNMH